MTNPRTILALYKSWGCVCITVQVIGLMCITSNRMEGVGRGRVGWGGGGRYGIVWCTCIYRAYTSACNDYTIHDICTQIQQNRGHHA